MDKKELRERLLLERSYLEALLNQFPKEVWERPLLAADWSLRDLLYHIAWYEEQTALYLESGRLVGSPWWSDSLDVRNEKILAAGRELGSDTVRQQANAIFKRLVDLLDQLPQALLDDPTYIEGMPADWMPWEGVRTNGYAHYWQHMADIVVAFDRWEKGAQTIDSFQLDGVKITIITTGHLRADLEEWWSVEKEEMGGLAALVERPFRLPMQAILIETAETKILVDIPLYDLTPESPYYLTAYQPPADCVTQLATLGIEPEQIEHLLFTHFHFDHINGAAVEKDGVWRPLFPNAIHYLGAADWASAEVQAALQDSDSIESRVLGMLHREEKLTFVAQSLSITPEVELVVTGGESPGHQILCLRTAHHRLYCLGDLFHHIAESYRPELMTSWVDREKTADNRIWVKEAALRERWLFICAHIRGVGRIEETAVGLGIVIRR